MRTILACNGVILAVLVLCCSASAKSLEEPDNGLAAAEATLMAADDALESAGSLDRVTIPLAFQGEWREDPADCGRHVESELIIRPLQMSFYESVADVQSVTVKSPRAIVVSSIAEGEGQVWERTDTILLSRDGSSLAFQGENGPYTRQRCE